MPIIINLPVQENILTKYFHYTPFVPWIISEIC
jgi:hypothetical protein